MTLGCEEFYRQRDQRTTEYVGSREWDQRQVNVKIGPDASLQAGQIALLALTNQLARVHRRIVFTFVDESIELVIPTVVSTRTVAEAVINTARIIDPCGEFSIGQSPVGSIAIGVGGGVSDCEWYIGATGAIAILEGHPALIADSAGTTRGAALAACLGAAAVFRTQLGLPTRPRRVSAWNYLEGDNAAIGPAAEPAIEVGSVLMVGAGAVGGNLAYWLHAFGFRGEGWVIADGDDVEIHNTNRGLLFMPADAGWPNGPAINKAALAATYLPGAQAAQDWYDQFPHLQRGRFDVVLALANDRDVRIALAHRHDAIALQATTGENWVSQLHRHCSGRDGCINCRTGELKPSQYLCSGAQVHTANGKTSDAALPFLSAASALMLVTALERIACGEMFEGEANCWSWDFDSPHRMSATPSWRVCDDGCGIKQSASIRRQLDGGTRWADE